MATKNPVSVITDASKLDAAIIEVNKRANSLVDSIQLVLASAVYQATFGRNTNHVNAVIHAVGRGVRKQAIAQWLLAYAPVMMETDAEKAKDKPFRFSQEKLDMLFPDAADSKKITAEEAMAQAEFVMEQNWADYKEPPLVPEKWDVADALRKVIATAKSMQGKKVNITNADILGHLADLLPKAKDTEQPQGL